MFFNLARCSGNLEKIIYFGSGAEYGKHRDLRKVKETEFDVSCAPKDEYGFYKYICSKYAEKSDKTINLRLFGAFGKHENYECRFISNAILKNQLGLPITINQNVTFDYLYIKDLVGIVEYFLKTTCKYKTYNVTPDKSIDLIQIAEIINRISPQKSEIVVLNKGMNYEYTGDNSRLKGEIDGLRFTSYEDSIKELFDYYSHAIGRIDKSRIMEDPYLSKCKAKKC